MSRISVVIVFCCMIDSPICNVVARMQRSGMRGGASAATGFPDCASLHPGYEAAALFLRPGQRDVTLGAEHVAVEVGDPLPPDLGLVEVADLGLDVRCDAVPIELRIAVHDVGWRIVAELAID